MDQSIARAFTWNPCSRSAFANASRIGNFTTPSPLKLSARHGFDHRNVSHAEGAPFRSPSVRGQVLAKRALEIAAAGGHNVVLVGPPGCGKTMLARRLPSILPAMTTGEALDVTKVYSVAGLLGARPRVVSARPFRAPHHTASKVSLVGGGSIPRPGEISLAQHGVLYLDD